MDFTKTQSLPLRRQAKTIRKVMSTTHFITLIRATITSYSKKRTKTSICPSYHKEKGEKNYSAALSIVLTNIRYLFNS